MKIRNATLQDVDQLALLGCESFPSGYQYNERKELLLSNPRRKLEEDVLVIEENSEIVASLSLLNFTIWISGIPIKMLGIAGVINAMEARRRGHASKLCIEALQRGLDRGCLVSILYPFRFDFYQKLGWGTIGAKIVYRFNPANLPCFESRLKVRRFKVGSKEDLELVKQCYQRFVERKNFMTEELDSGWELWQKNLEKRKFICMIFEDESTIQGYVTYHFDKAESMVKQSINISELIYDNNRAYQGLMGFISSLSDQITEVIYCAHPDEGFHFLLKNPRDCNDPLIDNGMLSRTGYYSVSYMMRVLDVAGALNARPNYNGVTGKVIFEIIDPQLEGNNRNFCLELLNGKPTVSQVGNDPDSRKNLIKLDISLFSQLYSGALSATRAAFFGQIEASNNETLLLLDEIFKLEKPFLLEQF